MKKFHTVIRLETVKDHNLKVKYVRVEDNYYESAEYYEKYYTDSYSYPHTLSAVVINQFTTEDEDE